MKIAVAASLSLLLGVLACTQAKTDAPAPATAPPASGTEETTADASVASGLIVELESARRVLWIGAHPDDETVIAPVLAHLCGTNGTTCALLVLTRGEDGGCKLPDGCKPDLGTVRDAEMRASAKIFGAELVPWDLGDVQGTPADVMKAWSAEAGSEDDLVGGVVDEIERVRPDLILTFDPRHGVTCHAAHRTAGTIALRAAAQAGIGPEKVFVASGKWVVTQGTRTTFGFARWTDDDPALVYDATASLPARQGTGWDWLVKVLEAHPSQFRGFADAARAAPTNRRIVPLVRATDAAVEDARYTCP